MEKPPRRRLLSHRLSPEWALQSRTDVPGDLTLLTLKQASGLIRSRKVSPVDLTQACLAAIERDNPKTNAWITVMRDQALAAAKELAREQATGRFRSPLHGIPIGLKDNIDSAGTRTTAGSKTLEGNVPTEDAFITRRLRDSGAVLIGKCNMHIFAQGATSAVSYFGPVRNPWNLELIAGGSSGGSAAAVATNNCYAALGTDTGGSIRTPAAMCGVVGFKPTYGRVSIRGIVPLTWSLDHCGPIARTVEDTALVLQSIAGYDLLDLQSIEYPVPDYSASLAANVSQFRIGVSPMFFDGLDAEIGDAVQRALTVLSGITKGTCEIQMPNVLGTGAGSEGAVYREALGTSFTVPLGSPPAAPPTGGNSGSGRAVDYIREWRQLRLLRRIVNEDVFQKQNVDVLVTPTIRHLPWSVEEELGRLASGRARHPEPGNTRSIDDYGLPTITLPCGFSKAGLPIGLQISGPNLGEGKALALAQAFERATDWHTRRPLISPDTKIPALSATAAAQTGEALNR